ncbi:MAG: ATP-binding protein [Candidatus Eremiobacteraeota bacterium]|nr:ATP-binding protein [Candidatus Eremiobacteraeota bacterium]
MEQEFSLLESARNFVLPLVAAAMLAGCGGGSGTSSVTHMPAIQPGQVLSTATLRGAPGFVNAAGLTVYVFDADLASPGHSVCNGACAANWPPLAAPASSLPAPWSTITRSDGSLQLAYSGRPLYMFAFDTRAGDTNGDGVNAFGGLWHIARPKAVSSATMGGGGPY